MPSLDIQTSEAAGFSPLMKQVNAGVSLERKTSTLYIGGRLQKKHERYPPGSSSQAGKRQGYYGIMRLTWYENRVSARMI